MSRARLSATSASTAATPALRSGDQSRKPRRVSAIDCVTLLGCAHRRQQIAVPLGPCPAPPAARAPRSRRRRRVTAPPPARAGPSAGRSPPPHASCCNGHLQPWLQGRHQRLAPQPLRRVRRDPGQRRRRAGTHPDPRAHAGRPVFGPRPGPRRRQSGPARPRPRRHPRPPICPAEALLRGPRPLKGSGCRCGAATAPTWYRRALSAS